MKGFVAFEFTSPPVHWGAHNHTLRNVPEIASRLRMFLVHNSTAGSSWQSELTLEMSNINCEKMTKDDPAFDFKACIAAARRKPTSRFYNLADISINLGHTTAVDFGLAVHGWPRGASLKAQLQAALAAPPAQSDGPQLLFRALPYLSTIGASQAARLVTWSNDYHEPLGFAGTVMYVLAKDAAELVAQPGIQALVAAKRLTLVLWDEFATYQGWRDFDLLVVQDHAVLSLWGRNVLVLVMDIDEFVMPATSGSTLPKMLAPGGCLSALRPECRLIRRWNIFPHRAVVAGASAPDEPSLWRTAAGPNPLYKYKFSEIDPLYPEYPKALMDPDHVMPVAVHYTSICTGTSAIANASASSKLRSACSTREPCPWVSTDCVYIAHVENQFVVRSVPTNATAIKPSDWLWMLDKSNGRPS